MGGAGEDDGQVPQLVPCSAVPPLYDAVVAGQAVGQYRLQRACSHRSCTNTPLTDRPVSPPVRRWKPKPGSTGGKLARRVARVSPVASLRADGRPC